MRGLEVDPSLCGQSAARTRVMMIFTGRGRMERVKGIEPSSQAWEARILPLNHTRFHS